MPDPIFDPQSDFLFNSILGMGDEKVKETEVEDDGENVKPRTEKEWAEMDKGDDEYHADVDNNL